MQTFKDFLVERYLTIHPDRTPNYHEEKEKFVKDNWHHIQKSYEKIGGFAGASSPEELAKDIHTIKAVKRDGKVVAATGYKKQHGRKAIVAFTDGSDHGKAGYRAISKEDDTQTDRHAWAEKSGPAAAIADKTGARKVSNTHAEKLTGKAIISKDENGHHYTRLIGGKPYKKAIYGHPEGV